MVNIVLCVDNGVTGATIAAFQLLTSSQEVSKQKDKIFVVNVVTTFDILNEEKNAGNLALAEWGGCLRQLGYNISTIQIEGLNTNSTLLSFIQEVGAKHVFIGNTSFSSVSEDSNIVLSIFSSVKRKVQGSTADYLVYWLDPSTCKVHVGIEKLDIIQNEKVTLSNDEQLERAIKLDHDIIQRPEKTLEEKNEKLAPNGINVGHLVVGTKDEEFKEEEI